MSSKPTNIPQGAIGGVSSTETVQTAQIEAASRRVFSRASEDPPAPIYVNNVEFGAFGVDVFMDAGVVTPEALKAAIEQKTEGAVPFVNFNVNYRFGMSLHAAAVMHQRLTQLLQQSQVNALQQAAALAKQQAAKEKSEKKD